MKASSSTHGKVKRMATEHRPPQSAMHYDVTADAHGRVELTGPFRPGQRLTIFVLPEAEEFTDLTAAATTSLEFWDNPLDDEDWNEAPAG